MKKGYRFNSSIEYAKFAAPPGVNVQELLQAFKTTHGNNLRAGQAIGAIGGAGMGAYAGVSNSDPNNVGQRTLKGVGGGLIGAATGGFLGRKVGAVTGGVKAIHNLESSLAQAGQSSNQARELLKQKGYLA